MDGLRGFAVLLVFCVHAAGNAAFVGWGIDFQAASFASLESDALRLYLEGSSYEQMAEELGCDTKTIDNALQRVKRKILNHQRERQVLQ